MEIIDYQGTKLVKADDELTQITIGCFNGLWALNSDVTKLYSGEVCLSEDAHYVNSEFFHEDEFDDYEIVYDEYYAKYVFEESGLFRGIINTNGDIGYFSHNADYVCYDDTYYMTYFIANCFNIYYCDECEENYHTHIGCDCNDRNSKDKGYCYGYHNVSRVDKSNGSYYKIGLEVEKEDETELVNDFAYKIYDDTGWVKEQDSSLDSGSGFEMVSPILPLCIDKPVYEQEAITNSIKLVERYINAKYSNNCGGHINVSLQDVGSRDLLYSIAGYIPLLYSIYESRKNNDYSKAMPLDKYDVNYKKAFNFKQNGVLELRIFPAVKNTTNLLWRIELVRLFLKYHTNKYNVGLLNMANPKHELHQHLLKVFDKTQLLYKCKLFVANLEEIDNIVIGSKTINRAIAKLMRVA